MIYKAILYPDLTGTAVSSPLSAKGNYIYCADVSVSRGLASEFLSGKEGSISSNEIRRAADPYSIGLR